MLKWFSGEEGEPGSADPGSPRTGAGGGQIPVEEMTERLTQTEQLVAQLKEIIRERDAALCSKDDQLKVEKEAYEAKLSKLRLQNKAKVASLTSQLEELKKHGDPSTPTHSKKGSSDGGGDQASRGKIVLLKKKVEELEQQLAQRDKELENIRKELECQRQRGEEMDTMLTEKDKRLAEKEAYIVHLQTGLAGVQPVTPASQHKVVEGVGEMQDLHMLVQSLTKKVEEAEERYSLLHEQMGSLKDLLTSEREQFSQKENMYKQNIQTFKDILIQKENQLMEINQMHEQELFRLAAKSDASADLEQLLKALKQKLHEKEEVLLGKAQVIDVLQGEVDSRDQQIKELTERLRWLQVERESLESKLEAEKHVMRAQLRDLIEKHQVEVQRMTEQHQAQMVQIQQDLLGQLEELRRTSLTALSVNEQASGGGNLPTDSASIQRITELEAQAKQKTEDASRSEAKFLKIKAWSKSRIKQLEEELKKSRAGAGPPDLMALWSRITALEEEREENLWKLEQYEELKAKSEMLEAKLVLYEEQQRTLQADLEQFTKRAASQASESGSADDTQSQVLEWQEMVAETVSARDRAREEKAVMALRISHMEEEREAMATRQQELEEELAQVRGLGQQRSKKLAVPGQRSLQEDFEFDAQSSFPDPRSSSGNTTPMEGENMGGWWPEYSTPDTGGLRSVVEELELERNQLQEQILSLEERCQDLEDRFQLQARIEALQSETEKLQSQLASVRSQQSRDAEKHQLLVNNLNEQLKGLTDTQECLESSLIEKENALARTSDKLELISSLRETLSEKEIQYKELSDKLLQTEHSLENNTRRCSSFEKQCSELKTEVADLKQKLSVLKEKAQNQEVSIVMLQTELGQTNEELDKLNTSHLEERAQLIHDLQSCEREIDSLKDILLEKDKEILSLAGNMSEYAEQVTVLKQELQLKEESLIQVEEALSKAEQQAMVIKDSQNSDQQVLNSKFTDLFGQLRDTEVELEKTKEESLSKAAEVEQLIKQAEDNKKLIQDLRRQIQEETSIHHNHLSECETHIASLKEQLTFSAQKLHESEGLMINKKLQQETYEKELKSFKEEQNKLLAQVEKYNNEIQTLSRRLEEQIQSEEHMKQAMKEKLEAVASLENQLQAADKKIEDEKQKFNKELKIRDSENEKLVSELQSKSESISKLENHLKSTEADRQHLKEKLKELNEELELQKQQVNELSEKVTSALQLNSSLENQVHLLTEQKEKFQEEATERVKNIAEVTAEVDSLQTKIYVLEIQLSENNKTILGLQIEKKDLNQVIEQSMLSSSEILLKKTNECSHLNQRLREKEEEMILINEQVQNLNFQVERLQLDLAEKEQTAEALQAKIKAHHHQQTQLEEMVSLLQEQESNLKSLLMEKDLMLKQKEEENQSLQSEITIQKNNKSEFKTKVESLKEELSQLRQQFKETEAKCQIYKDELNERNEAMKSLNDQIRVLGENTRKFECEAEVTKSELDNLNSNIQSLTEENQQLHTTCESKQQDLSHQVQMVSELTEQLKASVEQNSTFSIQIGVLTEENQRLQEELAGINKSFFELTTERGLLQEKYSRLETQTSDSQRTVNVLLKEKEELKKLLQESEQSNLTGLLQKTNECADLSKTLTEKEDQLQSLQEQVSQLNVSLNNTEKVVSEQQLQLEAQQNQLVQLQDTISMLQEQGLVLKSGLMEKDSMLQQKAEECGVYQNELLLQKDLVFKMQNEVELLRRGISETKQQLEQRELTLEEITNEFQSHKKELSKRKESVLSLSSQLGAMNENATEKEAEITHLKASVQKLLSEKHQLMQEEEQRKAQMIGFKDSIQALNDQNMRLKSELQKTANELSESQELISSLRAEVSNKNSELKVEHSETEKIKLAMQDRENKMKKQESLIHQLDSRITEQEEQLKQSNKDNTSLLKQISELEGANCNLRGKIDSLTLESCLLKNTMEIKEQSSVEFQSHSATTVENLTSHLQAKEAECESLKEKISHLEESVSKLNSSLQLQMCEVDSLKKASEDKEVKLLVQSKSLVDFQRQTDEALFFKAQFIESTELVSQLQSQIQSLSVESENLKRSADETQSAFNNLQKKYAVSLEELQAVQKHLSEKTEEVSNLRAQLDEQQMAITVIETLRNELSVSTDELEKTKTLHSCLSKEKDEALASHQASVSQLTIEIERLKSQHLQVVAQMNSLTESLEQREMALHAINNQYASQAKQASQLLSELQNLKEQIKSLNEKRKIQNEENAHLQGEVRRLIAEKEEQQLKLVREFEEKLKTVQRGNEGSKNMKRELQELLKEKHQEINQLQQNCIRYQEVILDLESALKSSQSLGELLKEEMRKGLEKSSALEERSKQVEAELITFKKLLQEAEEKVRSIESEIDQLAFKVSQHNKQPEKTKLSQSVEETQMYMQNQLHQQIDELKNLKEKERQRVDELMQQLDTKDLEINTLKRAAETNEARLSALSSTPHAADTSRLWDDLYQKCLNKKDNQLLEQGSMITRFLEDMRRKDKELNELQVTKSRLERTLNDYSVAASAHQRQMFIMSATNAELSENAEVMAVQVKELATQVERLEQEKNALNQQLTDKEDTISQLQLHHEQMDKINTDIEAQLHLLQTQCDKFQADFEKQEGISLQLKTILQSKDAEISSLLSCRDGQMSGYLEQLQANYHSQASVYENRLTSLHYQREKADKKMRAFKAKVKSLQIQLNRSVQDKERIEAKMEMLKNSLMSLQNEREQLMSEYTRLEAKSQSGSEKSSTDREGGASKGFKHEIRKLLHQMDDLNSENAMLRAQLVRYREDLNQVLSLKENQLKVLLRKQQDVIRDLENQKAAAEKHLREFQLELQEKEEASSATKAENSQLKAQVTKLEGEILTQKEERATMNEGRVIADLQEAVAAKAAECNDLQQKLLSQKASADDLKGKLQLLESETDKKLSEAEDKYNSELDVFEREAELIRNEREMADQKVVELAKELLNLEQQLSDAKSQNKDIKTQNESLCKAMAALQNDRDQLIEDFKILRNRYDEELRQTQAALNKLDHSLQDTSSDLAGLTKERDILVQKLKAVESKDAQAELSKLLDKLCKALTEKERELKQVALENNTYSRQLSAFSKSMASLQNDRDRLMDELAGAKKVAESRQGSSPETVLNSNVENRGGIGDLESQKDGSVQRLKADELQQTAHREVSSYPGETTDLRSDAERKDLLTVKETTASADQSSQEDVLNKLEAERIQLHRDLQRCFYEIHQRDQYFQQLNSKLQQAVEEKSAVAAQLRSVSQTLQDTQNRCHWLETQIQGQVQGSIHAEVAPGAPQERSNDSMISESAEASQLRERLLEVEHILADERARRETAEEALHLAEDRAKTVSYSLSRDTQRDLSIEMETEEEWEALSLNPNQPLITRKVKGGMAACRRWFRGRSLYFSRLLTSRARSRYFFLAYLLTLHVIVIMCLTGSL
uniref:Golgin subfamily B member 1-like n=1 Tax=Kryptolebias marmoratus TaxID=37003 RepID=A0A3Q3A3Q5_KRYMA